MADRRKRVSADNRDRISSTVGADYIRCPWFRGHNSKKIVCKGPVDHSRYAIEFTYARDKEKHQKIFCENHYEKCEVCIMTEYMLDDE